MTDPMTDERLAETLWAARAHAKGIADPSPLATMPAYTRERYRRFAAEVAKLVDLDAARAELATTAHALTVTGEKADTLRGQRDRAEAELAKIRTTETDVTWLADGVRRLIKDVNIRTAKDPSDAQFTIAREVASHINAGILTAFVSSRVVDLSVEYVRQAEAERDEAREQVKRVRELLSQWERPDNLQVDLRDLRAALDGPETAPGPTDPA